MRRNLRFFLIFSLLTVIVAACASSTSPAPTQDTDAMLTQAVQTALAEIVTATPAPTETPLPTPTMVPRTPPALPPVFSTSFLNPMDKPYTYEADTCTYLKNKWDPGKSAPGTIVIVIMFHGIDKDGLEMDPNDISVQDFKKMMNDLHEMGFQAINAEQLANFLEHNAKIPERSIVLTYDDRHRAEAFEHFRPYAEQWGWPVINGWISAFGGDDHFLAENVALSKEGWVDYQAHGVVHNIPMSNASTDEYLIGELQGAIDNLQTHFNKTPIAIIWPGGGFDTRPVQFARQFGYRVGFTVNPRGPIMYNWVPLGEQYDERRPYYIPEGPVGDPVMTLPRYWPNQVLQNLDAIRLLGKEAAAYAEQNKAVELEYYDIACKPTYGGIPGLE
ncbi:MAG: hypothetical protein Kow002_17320 [Anaerolineales bacterium]